MHWQGIVPDISCMLRASNPASSPGGRIGFTEERKSIQEAYRSRVGWFILVVISVVYALALIVPFSPDFPKTADSETSWMIVMHAGWRTHSQFGSDRIFTYGPYGFCVPQMYYPGTYPILLAIRAAVGGVLLWTVWGIVPAVRRIADSPIAVALWMFPLLCAVTSSDDVLFPVCSVLLLVVYFYVDGMRLSAKSALLLAVLALAGLAKFTWLTINSTLVVLLTVDQLLCRRRWNFWIPGLYLAFLAALWLAAGQRVTSLVGYIRNSAEMAGGYTQAMMLLRGELVEIAEFVLAAGLLWVLVADVDWKLRRGRGVIHSLALAFVLFATFKQSFVRHDEAHVTVGPFLLLAIALLYAVVIWPSLAKLSHRAMWIAVVGLALVNASAAVAHYRPYGLLGHFARSMNFASQGVAGAWHLARGDGNFHGRYESALAQVRVAEPLPPISGSTDVYSNAQAVAIAYGLNYRPRPVFQAYAAYTPKLLDANLSYLRSDKAPFNILFDIQTIDTRLPSLDDGISWPDLLTRYDVAGLYETSALLRRAPAPRAYSLTPLTMATARFDEAIPVPPNIAGAVWAEVEINLSPRGKLASLLYRPPGLLIDVRTEGGNETFRFIAPIARAGFLVSPLVTSRGEFISLASTAWKEDLKARSVRTIVISAMPFGKVYDANPRMGKTTFDAAVGCRGS
jgi:hypothetical protein